MWFAVPHGAVAYVLLRRPEQFERGATTMYATFDLGAIVYHLAPTAPPWYAAAEGHATSEAPARRMMAEYGEQFWRDRWGPLYSVLGGNPLAAMPSLHFATSVMAARILSDAGPMAGALGWTYATVLGFALVYIGEHYAVDLVAGWALTEAVLRYGDRAAPLLSRLSRAIGWLEAQAHAGR
jgi:membrane-associated phospholipid phosphatase